MSRSPESLALRAEYARRWRRAHPDYGKAWSRTHREVDNARHRRLRSKPGWRLAHEPRRRIPPTPPIPALHVGHPLFEAARRLIRERWTGEHVYDATHEDMRSEAVVAMLEGRPPLEAARHFAAEERRWRELTLPLGVWLT